MPQTPSNAATVGLLLSGGLDSGILLGHLLNAGRRVQPFYVRCGLVWEDVELRAVRALLKAFNGHPKPNCGAGVPPALSSRDGRTTKHEVVLGRPLSAIMTAPLVVLEMPLRDLYGNHWSITGRNTPAADTPDNAVYLPGRNALLAIKPALWCAMHGIEELALAVLATDPFADATEEFFGDFTSALQRATGSRIKLTRPFAHLEKRDVMQLGQAMPLEWTFSCIAPVDDLHCGRCNKCAERQAAFRSIALDDPTSYSTELSTT